MLLPGLPLELDVSDSLGWRTTSVDALKTGFWVTLMKVDMARQNKMLAAMSHLRFNNTKTYEWILASRRSSGGADEV